MSGSAGLGLGLSVGGFQQAQSDANPRLWSSAQGEASGGQKPDPIPAPPDTGAIQAPGKPPVAQGGGGSIAVGVDVGLGGQGSRPADPGLHFAGGAQAAPTANPVAGLPEGADPTAWQSGRQGGVPGAGSEPDLPATPQGAAPGLPGPAGDQLPQPLEQAAGNSAAPPSTASFLQPAPASPDRAGAPLPPQPGQAPGPSPVPTSVAASFLQPASAAYGRSAADGGSVLPGASSDVSAEPVGRGPSLPDLPSRFASMLRQAGYGGARADAVDTGLPAAGPQAGTDQPAPPNQSSGTTFGEGLRDFTSFVVARVLGRSDVPGTQASLQAGVAETGPALPAAPGLSGGVLAMASTALAGQGLGGFIVPGLSGFGLQPVPEGAELVGPIGPSPTGSAPGMGGAILQADSNPIPLPVAAWAGQAGQAATNAQYGALSASAVLQAMPVLLATPGAHDAAPAGIPLSAPLPGLAGPIGSAAATTAMGAELSADGRVLRFGRADIPGALGSGKRASEPLIRLELRVGGVGAGAGGSRATDRFVTFQRPTQVLIDLAPETPATPLWRLDDTRTMVMVGAAGEQAAASRAAGLYRALIEDGAGLEVLRRGEGFSTWEGSPLWLSLAGVAKPRQAGVLLSASHPWRVELIHTADGEWEVTHSGIVGQAPQAMRWPETAVESDTLLLDVLYRTAAVEPALLAGFVGARAASALAQNAASQEAIHAVARHLAGAAWLLQTMALRGEVPAGLLSLLTEQGPLACYRVWNQSAAAPVRACLRDLLCLTLVLQAPMTAAGPAPSLDQAVRASDSAGVAVALRALGDQVIRRVMAGQVDGVGRLESTALALRLGRLGQAPGALRPAIAAAHTSLQDIKETAHALAI